MPMKIDGMPNLRRIETSLKVISGDKEVFDIPSLLLYERVRGHAWIWSDDPVSTEEIKKAAIDTIVDAFKALGAEY